MAIATSGDDILLGTAGADTIDGLGGRDEITGGYGADTIIGGAGRDRLIIRGAADIAPGESYSGGADHDTLLITANGVNISMLTIGADVEGLTASSRTSFEDYDIALTASQLSGFQHIWVRHIRVTTGGLIDLRNVSLVADSITLAVGGAELILVPDTYSPPVHGSEGKDKVTGSAYEDKIEGKGGDDILNGEGGDDVLRGGAGRDIVNGGGGNDTISIGFAGDEFTGDTLSGGGGLDTLFVAGDTILAAGLAVNGIEKLWAGTISADVALLRQFTAVYATDLTLTGKGILDLTAGKLGVETIRFAAGGITLKIGSDQAVQAVIGSAGADTFVGSGELIDLGAGDDIVRGSWSDDRIAEGGGRDFVDGGAGDDVIVFDAASDVVAGDRYLGGLYGHDVIEMAVAGVDLAASTISGFEHLASLHSVRLGADQLRGFTSIHIGGSVILTEAGVARSGGDILADSIELAVGGITLDLSAESRSQQVNGSEGTDIVTGTDGDDVIRGRGGDDVLHGGVDGDDLLVGGAGDDTYLLPRSAGWDRILEAADGGRDTVRTAGWYQMPAGIEVLIKNDGGTGSFFGFGNGLANEIFAGAGKDELSGAGGGDVLHGRAGADKLTGGAGADTFMFDSALNSASNVDQILDFRADDFIGLDRAVFAALPGMWVKLAFDAFVVGPAARDAEDRIVYDKAAGKLYYDPDGTGAAAKVLFAQVSAGTEIAHTDFQLFG